jgi:HK97 family phage portal protein
MARELLSGLFIMSILSNIKNALTGTFPNKRNLANPPRWLIDLWGGGIESKSGIKIDELNALQSTAVFACVRVLAETIASLPLLIYRRLPSRGKERASDHPLFKILHHLANPLMTSFEFRETLMGHILLWGNAFAEIERDIGNRIIGLWPLLPNKMKIEGKGNTLSYFYTLPKGQEVQIPAINIFHVKGLSANGFSGQSVISFAREAIGLSIAGEEFGSRFFSNNAVPGGVYEHPGKLSVQARENLQKSIEEKHQGLSKAHRMAILEEGMKYHQIGIPGRDAQLLETRKFQVSEIARIYRVPPHLIGDLERATFSNVEQQAIDFVVHTVRPWLVRWEQAILRDLFEEEEREEFFAEFLVDALLRGDIVSRFEAYSQGRNWGWLSADDIRELENMNPLPGGIGQSYLIPSNMIPIKSQISRSNGKDLGFNHEEKEHSEHAQ